MLNVVCDYILCSLYTDKKKYKLLLLQKQPELLSYVTYSLTTSQDCVTALENMRDCRREVTLAEQLITAKYATLITVSSIQHVAPPATKRVVDIASVLPASESSRNNKPCSHKIRERVLKCLTERLGVRHGGIGTSHDDQVDNNELIIIY